MTWKQSTFVAGLILLLIGEGWFALRSRHRRARGEDGPGAGSAPVAALRARPVRGASWLKHLGLSLDQSRMGRMGGEGPAPRRNEPMPSGGTSSSNPLRRALERLFGSDRGGESAMGESFAVNGADLYRLDCQSCHGPAGAGAPPEIKPLLDPVRATSQELMRQRMRQQERPVNERLVSELADQALASLRKRIHDGGEKMPSFDHLQGEEVDALVGYLQLLAGVPGAADRQVTESVARVGEHLVKGTCHICHDATGPGGGHMMMTQGTVPSLASFPQQKSVDEVARKVLQGSWGMMAQRARMPVLPYLTEEEVAAGYAYLAAIPPEP